MTHEIHLTAEEVAEACREWVARATGTRIHGDPVSFDIEAAYHSDDPRENRTEATLRGATVRVEGGK